MTLNKWSRNISSSKDIDGNTHWPNGKKRRFIFVPELIMNSYSGKKENL
jgi:hypothetical protein